MRKLNVVAILAWLAAAPAAAQIPQPVVAAPPDSPDFLTRYDFHLTAAGLGAIDDQRFSWDTHFGGSLDMIDYVAGRAGIRVDYEAVLGSQYRAFDPNQGNYTLEANASARIGDHTEVVGLFHHVSRHLSDRPKLNAIAWNVAGVRVLERVALGGTTVDAEVEGSVVTQHSYVDYKWIGDLELTVRHPITPRVGLFAQGAGQLYGTDETVYNRGTQFGGLAEVGVRIGGRGGAMELFAGGERRIDAYPIGQETKQWTLAGFRLLSR